jgi:hypothetical protein
VRRLAARIVLGLGLVAGTVGFAAPVAAAGDDDARQVLSTFARCVVREDPASASKAVIEDWDGPLLTDSRKDVLAPKCLRDAGFVARLRTGAVSLKSVLAEELIRANRGLAPGDLSEIAPLAYRMPTPVVRFDKRGKRLGADAIEAQERGIAAKLTAIVAQQVGECLVRARPVEALQVVATEAGSDDELAKLQAIAPALPGCVPKGKTISFNRASVRGGIALSYYRLAMAARGKAWAGEAH